MQGIPPIHAPPGPAAHMRAHKSPQAGLWSSQSGNCPSTIPRSPKRVSTTQPKGEGTQPYRPQGWTPMYRQRAWGLLESSHQPSASFYEQLQHRREFKPSPGRVFHKAMCQEEVNYILPTNSAEVLTSKVTFCALNLSCSFWAHTRAHFPGLGWAWPDQARLHEQRPHIHPHQYISNHWP